MADGTLNVEKEELLARAFELEAPIAGIPSDYPHPPCALALVITAAEQLDWSANQMRRYLGVGERERQRLAESLRNAAKAYEEVDESAAQAINDETSLSVSAATIGLGDDDLDALSLDNTPAMTPIGDPEYADYKTRAWELEKGDQGAAFRDFAEAWEAHRQALLEATERFRPFDHWESDAAQAVEANFEQHRTWLYRMAELCTTVANQARNVVAAQRWAHEEHVWWDGGGTVTPRQLKFRDLEEMDFTYSSNYSKDPNLRSWYLKRFAELQQQSETVIDGFAGKASLPLSAVNPLKPPIAHRIDPPGEKDGTGGDNGGGGDKFPWDEGLPDPTGMPSVPSAGAPGMPDGSTLTDALPDAMAQAPGVPTGSGVKPASVGGGGAGVPSMPLLPWHTAVDPESMSRPAPAGRPVGMPAMPGGAMGGSGMGGMAPMGGAPGAGTDQGAGKSKRANKDDKSLYTEDRPWTEGVIGVSPADAKRVSKDSK